MWRDKSVVASKRGLRDFLVEAFSLGGINGISASSDTGFEQDCDINVFPLGRCWPVGDLHREVTRSKRFWLPRTPEVNPLPVTQSLREPFKRFQYDDACKSLFLIIYFLPFNLSSFFFFALLT